MMTSPKVDGPDLTASSKWAAAGPAMAGAWLSVRGGDRDVTPGLSSSGQSYDQSTWPVQAGLDVIVSEAAGGTWVVGGNVFAGGGKLQARTTLGDGVIAADATGAGLTAEFGIGGSIDWQQTTGGMTSLFGEVTALQGPGGGDMTGVSGTAGEGDMAKPVRHRWAALAALPAPVGARRRRQSRLIFCKRPIATGSCAARPPCPPKAPPLPSRHARWHKN